MHANASERTSRQNQTRRIKEPRIDQIKVLFVSISSLSAIAFLFPAYIDVTQRRRIHSWFKFFAVNRDGWSVLLYAVRYPITICRLLVREIGTESVTPSIELLPVREVR